MRVIETIKGWAAKRALSALGVAFARGEDIGGASASRLTEPYRKSAWVRAAIDKISGPIASVEVEFYAGCNQKVSRKDAKTQRKAKKLRRRNGRIVRVEEEKEVSDPVMEGFLREPMAGMLWSDFVEATVGWLRLAGESFWIVPDDAMPFPEVANGARRVIVARPDRMRHLVKGGVLEGWMFTDAAGKQIALDASQVIHLKQWNPYDQWRGLGQFEAAALAAEADHLAGKFARNLMANNGDTGPYVVCKSGIPTDEQREQMLAQLRAKRAAQLRGDFRPVVLGGDITVEDPQVRTVDAAYIQGRIENRHEVFVALGVPPSMADVKAAYSIGSASDFYQLILNTCMPAGDKLCDGLSKLARILTKKDLQAFLDWDEHPVMQEVRKERLASVDVLWSKGMPMAGISEYLSLGLPRFEGDEVGYLPFSVAPVGEAVAPTEDPGLAEAPAVDAEKPEDQVQEMIRTLKGSHAKTQRRQEEPECGCGCGDGEIDQKRDAKEIAQWKELMGKRRATVRAYESKFNRELMKARAEVLRKIEAQGKILRVIGRAVATDFLFDLESFTKGITAAMRGVGMQALQTAGDQLFKELGKDDPWKMPPERALSFLDEREKKIKDASDAVFDQIRGTLQDGLDQGDTMAELADRVRTEFNGISKSRSTRIAMTETGAAYGVARQEAMAAAGVQNKKWLTSGNSNVRQAHRQMNGTVIPIGETFTVVDPESGEVDEVEHPGDPDGAPWNVINCHCVAIATTEEPGVVELPQN